MLQVLLPAAAFALLFVVYRDVARLCRFSPQLRRWFVLGGIVGLVGCGLMIPWVWAKLEPPYSESPAGIFVILGKVIVAGSLGLASVGCILGAAAPRLLDRSGPAA